MVQLFETEDFSVFMTVSESTRKVDIFEDSKRVDLTRSLGFYRSEGGRIGVNVYESGFMGKKMASVYVDPETAIQFADELRNAARLAQIEQALAAEDERQESN